MSTIFAHPDLSRLSLLVGFTIQVTLSATHVPDFTLPYYASNYNRHSFKYSIFIYSLYFFYL